MIDLQPGLAQSRERHTVLSLVNEVGKPHPIAAIFGMEPNNDHADLAGHARRVGPEVADGLDRGHFALGDRAAISLEHFLAGARTPRPHHLDLRAANLERHRADDLVRIASFLEHERLDPLLAAFGADLADPDGEELAVGPFELPRLGIPLPPTTKFLHFRHLFPSFPEAPLASC